MEFSEYKCPVCNKPFKKDDDIVVCPDCGTPQHRGCYEELNHCFFKSKHSKDFSFDKVKNEYNTSANTNNEKSENTVCPLCGFNNAKGAFFCVRCQTPLNKKNETDSVDKQQPQAPQTEFSGNNAPPFVFGAGAPAFDPLAGLDSDEEIAENVKVGEMAKFVGKSTQYYLIVFKKIKELGSSRFNFGAFIFSSYYFLYRKMTAIGILLTVISTLFNVGSTYIMLMPEWLSNYNTLMQAAGASDSIPFSELNMPLLYAPFVLSLFKYAIMFVSGFTANKLYRKHCINKINAIKSNAEIKNKSEALEKSGGVSVVAAVSFMVAGIIISYICQFLLIQANIV